MKTLWPLLMIFFIASCGSTKKEEDDKEEEKKEPETRVVGRIASVSPHSGFVLIQKYGAGRLPSHGIYQSIGEDGRTASIRPSGERVRDFFAADIINGEVKSGDAVIYRPLIQEKPTMTPITPEETPQDQSP